MSPRKSEDIAVQASRLADARFAHVIDDHPVMPVLRDIYAERIRKDLEAGLEPPKEKPSSAGDREVLTKNRLTRQPLGPLDVAVERLKLPTMPGIWLRLRQAMENPESTSEDLAKIISVDPKLTATVLALVNCPLFGLPVKVETLTRAVTVLGTRQISGLAMSAMLVSMFQDTPPDVIEAKDFWRHCVVTATLARNLALFVGREDTERYFVAGLLHDLGRVALYSSEPGLARMALALERTSNMELVEAERKVFDFDHAMLGALVLQRWYMPGSVVYSAMTHHLPEQCLRSDVATVVHVANGLAVALDLGGCHEAHAQHIGSKALDKLHLDPLELPGVIHDMEVQVEAVFSSLVD